MTKVKTQNKQIKKRSIADDFGLHANNFSLLHSPGRQLCPYGKELFKSKLVPNGDFRDFTMEDDANTVGHYIFDKSYEREDKNTYIGSERGGEETVHYQSDFSSGMDGWHIYYLGVGQEAVATWNSSLQALNLAVTVNGVTPYRPSWGKTIPAVEDGANYELVINCIINSGTFIIVGHLLGGGWTDIPDWTLTTGENRKVITANGASGNWSLYTDGLNYLYNIDITSIELRKLPAKSLLPAGFSDNFEDEYTTDPSNPAYQNGGVLEFNGIDQYFYIPYAQAGDFLVATSDFTIEAWIYSDDYGNYQGIFSRFKTDVTRLEFYVANRQLVFRAEVGDVHLIYGNSGTSLTNGTWHHAVIVVDNSTEARFYVDAIDKGTCSTFNADQDLDLGNTGKITIGYMPYSYYWDDSIAEVRFTKSALTTDEIKQSYGAGKGWTFGTGFTTKENDNFTQKLSADTITFGIQSFNFEDSKLYKCGFRAKGYSGNANDEDIAMHTSLGPIIGYQSVGTDETWHEYNTYFAGDGGDSLNLYVGSGSQIAIDNIKVQEVNIPPVSNFAEDFSKGGEKKVISTDLVPTNPTCEGTYTAGLAPSWTQAGTITASEQTGLIGSAQGFTSLGAINNGNVECLANPSILSSGKMYRISFHNKRISGTNPTHAFGIIGSSISGYPSTDVSDTWTYREYVWFQTADSGADPDRIKFGMVSTSQTSVFAVDNVKIEEVTNGNHGLMQNDMEDDQPTYPYALEYNGVDQSIKYGVINIDKDDSFILFAWIYINIDGVLRTILSNQDNAPTYRGFIFYVDVAEKLGAIFRNTTSNYLGKYVNTALFEGWHFATVSYDGSLSVSGMKLYLDNVEITETTILANSLTNTTISSVPIYSGAREGINNFYNNKIGDTGIILFDGNAGRPSSLPSNYIDWISRIYNTTKWKYKN